MVGRGETGPAMHAEDARAGVLFPRMLKRVLCVNHAPRIALLYRIPSGENDGEQRMRIAQTPQNQGMILSMIDACIEHLS